MCQQGNILIYGTGNMGRAMAISLARTNTVFLIGRDEEKAKRLAQELGVKFFPLKDALLAASVILLVLPAHVIPGLLKTLQGSLKPGTILFDLSTDSRTSLLRSSLGGDNPIVGAKIIGSCYEMDAPPVIIIDAESELEKDIAVKVFGDCGEIIFAAEEMAAQVNTVVAERILTAALDIREVLQGRGITDERIISSALQAVAPGTLKAYIRGELGSFGRKFVSCTNKGD